MYLNTSDKQNTTVVTKGDIEAYAFDASEVWVTEKFTIDKSVNSVSFHVVQESPVGGSGELSLQRTVNGVDWINTGQTISLTSNVNTVLNYFINSKGSLRLSNDGNGTGSITIYMVQD